MKMRNKHYNFVFPGDEIFSVNGRSVAGLTHSEAASPIHIFLVATFGPGFKPGGAAHEPNHRDHHDDAE